MNSYVYKNSCIGIGLIVVALLYVSACGAEAMEKEPEAQAELHGVKELVLGYVHFYEVDNEQVRLDVQVQQLKPGWHGFHIHEKRDCQINSDSDPSDNDPFLNAGGHLGSGEHVHHSNHQGDLPPLLVNEDGSAQMSVILDKFHIHELLSDSGAAVIIHDQPDNFAHIPDRYQSVDSDQPGPDQKTLATGDSGERIACGEIVGTE